MLRRLCVGLAERLVQHTAGAVRALAAAGGDARHARQIAHRASTIRHRLVNGFFVDTVTDANDHG